MRRVPCTVSALLVLATLTLLTSQAFAQREWRTDYTQTELATGGAIISCFSTPFTTSTTGDALIESREEDLKDENKKLQDLLSWMEGYLPNNQQALSQAFGLGQGDVLNDLLLAFGHRERLSPAQQRALRAKRRQLWDAMVLKDGAARASTVHAIIYEVLQTPHMSPAIAHTTAQSKRQAQ